MSSVARTSIPQHPQLIACPVLHHFDYIVCTGARAALQ